jgi:Tfp pilus assembly major pilin PilA
MKFNKDKKQEKKDEANIESEIVLDIHRMPKGYKTGRFEVEKRVVAGYNENSGGTKKVGIFIIVFGIIVIIAIAYFVYASVFKKSESENKVVETKNTETNIIDNSIIKNTSTENQISETIEENNTSSTSTENIITSEETNSTTSSTTTENTKEEFSVVVDSDKDGLSDDEEFILGTKFNESDSDGDSFSDFTEAMNLYNPTGNGPISNNVNITKYENKAFSYSILYPKNFGKSVLTDESSLVLSIDDNAFFQILVEKNSNNFSIKDWYADRFFALIPDANVISNNVWDGVYDSEGLALYLTDKQRKNVYTILYNTTNNQKTYINIFNMMIKSFTLN